MGSLKEPGVDASDVKRKKEKKEKKEKKDKKDKKEREGHNDGKKKSTSSRTDQPRTETSAREAREFLKKNEIVMEMPEDSTEKTPLPMLSFDELDGQIDPRLKERFDAEGFKQPTLIQSCCWPVMLQGKDIVGVAETGSGKTLAFGVPALQHVIENQSNKKLKKAVQVLVIAPTRELAIQTRDNLARVSEPLGFGTYCLYGGVSKSEQLRSMQKSALPVNIIVGTPGRVLDLAREGSLDLSHVSFLTLDEADRMLDKGFEPDIRAIIAMTISNEEGRRTSMFSATWPPAVRGLAETFMRDPIRVTVGSDELSANRKVSQEVEVLQDGYEKERRLNSFLRASNALKSSDKILIFALYKKEAQRVENTLRRWGYKVSGIHGDLNQHDRIASLEAFKSGETPLLVATDVAARGLDIPNVEQVINYTFPLTIEDYIHRIGRTGRGGKTGKALSFFTDEDKAHAGELIRVLKDANQPVPEAMNQFPTTIKRKTHSSYGDHYKELVPGKAKKITFDDD
ncbi:RNA helicase [Malassezia yamatoensis]|uniref:RNA helicase n=1 Tax=Malassezia yamatoensis TaxID=253288 RepID=A0AAJ6CGV6_9BASI|nr:RNA helicase [Malassezia yamatoensis]